MWILLTDLEKKRGAKQHQVLNIALKLSYANHKKTTLIQRARALNFHLKLSGDFNAAITSRCDEGLGLGG